MKSRHGGILLGALFSVGVMSQALADDKVVIGYSAPALLGGQGQIQAGLVNGAKAKGWEVITITSGGDAQKQLNDINDLIAQEVDAIVAVPDDSAGICQAVAVAKEAKIPFYTIDRAPSGCQVDMVVLSDNYLAGKQAGEAMVEFLKARHGSPKGKVLEVTGNLAQNVAQLRGAGFNDVLKQYPDVTVITKVGDWDASKGVDIVRDVVSAEADLDGIYMHSDCVYSTGTVQTLKELGKDAPTGADGHIFLASVDACLAALELMRGNQFDHASNQPIPDFGLLAVDFIEKQLKGETIAPGEITMEGALWSPARVETADVGLQLFLATTAVNPSNMNDERLWGNIEKANGG
jgi:simple sugar transport system substrate-binding protein/ribose transport system substrate-binding protein